MADACHDLEQEASIHVYVLPTYHRRARHEAVAHSLTDSQCQAIHARSIFPCQDTPSVKSDIVFNIRSPLPVIAGGLPAGTEDYQPGEGDAGGSALYRFVQHKPIPSYLFAIASGYAFPLQQLSLYRLTESSVTLQAHRSVHEVPSGPVRRSLKAHSGSWKEILRSSSKPQR